jgi:hypothetical protein
MCATPGVIVTLHDSDRVAAAREHRSTTQAPDACNTHRLFFPLECITFGVGCLWMCTGLHSHLRVSLLYVVYVMLLKPFYALESYYLSLTNVCTLRFSMGRPALSSQSRPRTAKNLLPIQAEPIGTQARFEIHLGSLANLPLKHSGMISVETKSSPGFAGVSQMFDPFQ